MKPIAKAVFVGMSLAVLNASALTRAADKAYDEKYRPQFHFSAARDWLNDPNGLVYYDGEYHLFFQRLPGRLESDGTAMAWGHAVSPDLVHWTQLTDAFTADATHNFWSGSAVVDWQNTSGFGSDGRPPMVAFYTNAKPPFAQHVAYSNDRGRTWTQFAGNPVVAHVNGQNRDPKVVWHAQSKQWVMAIYLDQPARYALYTSPNLTAWTPLQEVTLDFDGECPDFFPLNLDGDPAKQKWVFTGAGTHYVVGTFDGKTFARETDSTDADRGNGLYAAQTFSDIPAGDGRRVQIGWMRGPHYDGMPFSQNMSFPTELTLRSTPRGPRLFRWPVKEIESLYGNSGEWHDRVVRPGREAEAVDFDAELLDLTAEIDLSQTRHVTLVIRGRPVTLDVEGDGLSLAVGDRRVSLTSSKAHVTVRVLADRTSMELFADDGQTVLTDCVNLADGPKALTLRSVGGPADFKTLAVHELRPAWPGGK